MIFFRVLAWCSRVEASRGDSRSRVVRAASSRYSRYWTHEVVRNAVHSQACALVAWRPTYVV